MTKSKIVGFIIIFDKVLPQSLLGHLSGTLAYFFHLGIRLCGECGDGVLDAVGHFGIVIVRTVKHLYPIIDAMLILQAVYPKPETGKVGSDGGAASG